MQNELVVELLGEGGSRALYAVRDGDDWLFSRRGPISAPSATIARRWKGVVVGWAAALEELDHFGPWYELVPKELHPEFSNALLEASRERGASPRAIERWEEACRIADSRPGPIITEKAVHSSDSWLYFEDPDVPAEAK